MYPPILTTVAGVKTLLYMNLFDTTEVDLKEKRKEKISAALCFLILSAY
jgi:hypothetical protein